MERRALLVKFGGAPILGLAVVLSATAAVAYARPFLATLHTWGLTLLSALAGLLLLGYGLAAIGGDLGSGRHSPPGERFAALGALGGALIAAALVAAAFSVGQPQRVAAAPGQTFRPSPYANILLRFPAAPGAGSTDGTAPPVIVESKAHRQAMHTGQMLRVGSYVFRAVPWPLAYVSVRSAAGKPVTVTQPNGAAFASPYLAFPFESEGRPADFFAVPPVHREIRVAYYSSLPGTIVDVPVLVVQINEENGGTLYQGATVSGKPIDKAGLRLTFALSTYPLILMTSAPARLPLSLGLAIVASAVLGYAWSSVRGRRTARAGA